MSSATQIPLLNNSAPSLIEQLLAEQQSLPAVQRFAAWHDEHEQGCAVLPPVSYRSLIPLTAPQAGEQYAFEVDLDACSGCKACVTACHSLNGLDEHETWRDVGLLISSDDRPSLQYITSACHHCVEPACLAGCPVKAYDKDPHTGIVRHLDDQCIGCQYCVLMCPYDVPKYSPSKGIVRKCDMCRQRLAADEAPACVGACPNQAIRITTVKKVDMRAAATSGEFLASAPDPRQTIPTTRYISKNFSTVAQQTWQAADAAFVKPAHAHWPLVVMLVLTQASVGVLFAERMLTWFGSDQNTLPLLIVSLILGAAGGQTAALHLGRPFGAWRAWLGLRTSWLSREIVVFGAYSGILGMVVGLVLAMQLDWLTRSPMMLSAAQFLATGALICGLLGVLSSAMIYAATQRPSWNLFRSGGKFFLTTLLFASIAAASLHGQLWLIAIAVAASKLIYEAICNWHSIDQYGRVSDFYSALGQAARLVRGPLERMQSVRTLLGCVAIVAMMVATAIGQADNNFASLVATVLVLVFVLAGELLERTLFFTAMVAPKMPGGIST
jgi:formate dehydrogenase iron-sulfur subunit